MKSNRLIHESSPYLLQHAHNPVDWYPWGAEALERARAENKMLLVSIGYSACHWCHVMEQESFEDEEVADLMNTHFVCIKVDREERPDIDKVYMDAVILMTQRGGWPLNAVALPDGRPVWGGTYFPKENWKSILLQLVQMYRNEPKRVLDAADQVESAILQLGIIEQADESVDPDPAWVESLLTGWMEHIDFEWGGRKVQANKFPLPINQRFLIRSAHFLGHEAAQEAADITLEKMAFGGIYDHLGGGFARYSVDAYWKVPHFEKMLYDNGQLVSLYTEAWTQNPRPLYRDVVYRTLAFIDREMTFPEGGFYSALDADSEGEEGRFYVWKYDEVEAILGAEAKLFADYYNLHPAGNWEGNNILFVLETEAEFANKWKLEAEDFSGKMHAGREKLLAQRNSRIRPGLDDKILAAWNGLMLKGYAEAYGAFGERRFLEAALRNAQFIRDKMTEGAQLYRSYKGGKRSIPGFLDDYAFVIEAYLALYQVSFDEQWLHQAHLHLEYVLEHFSDSESPLFFYTSDQREVLINRKIEMQDDVIPSSNASLANSLHDLGLILLQPAYTSRSRDMLRAVQHALAKNPDFHSHWGGLLLKQVFPHYEVAITGPEALDFRAKLAHTYHPGCLFAGATQSSQVPILQGRSGKSNTQIFVCKDNVCQLPVENVEAARELIQ